MIVKYQESGVPVFAFSNVFPASHSALGRVGSLNCSPGSLVTSPLSCSTFPSLPMLLYRGVAPWTTLKKPVTQKTVKNLRKLLC